MVDNSEAEPVRPRNFIGSKGLRASDKVEGEAEDDAEIVCEVREPEQEDGARAPRIASQPYVPTKAEIEAHFPLHAEYRNWCRFCVEGKGTSRQHRSGDTGESLGVTISLDYCFMVPEESEEGMDAILVAYDDKKMGLWAMAVESKGPTESSVKWMSKKIEDSGYNGVPITLKSDQGADIMQLKKAVSIKRESETSMVESPVRVSKANGQVERAIRTWQAQFRTLRVQLEDRLKTKLRKGSSLMSWLINFTGDVLCRYKVHGNGRTNYEMVTGHRFKQQVCGFAEKVHFKVTVDKSQRSKMETDWGIGYYLGSSGRTLEHFIGTEHGILRVDTFKRMTDDLAYDPACIEIVKTGYREFVIDGSSSKLPTVRSSDPLPRNPNESGQLSARGG